VQDLTVSADGRLLAALGSSGAVVFDVDTGAETASFSGPGSEGTSRTEASIALSPDGTLLALGCYDGDILVWDLQSHGTPTTISGHDGVVRALAFSPDGSLLASGGADTSVLIWQVDRVLPRRRRK
jgi:WD40 repeat protein